jgi:hypothetical protein
MEVQMRGNPLREFIPDNLYSELRTKGFLNERAIRDYYLKKRFIELRSEYSPREIFSLLQKEFSYICEDTIRKIIYSRDHLDAIIQMDPPPRRRKISGRIKEPALQF